jgi:hypothetical protein
MEGGTGPAAEEENGSEAARAEAVFDWAPGEEDEEEVTCEMDPVAVREDPGDGGPPLTAGELAEAEGSRRDTAWFPCGGEPLLEEEGGGQQQ